MRKSAFICACCGEDTNIVYDIGIYGDAFACAACAGVDEDEDENEDVLGAAERSAKTEKKKYEN